MADRKHYIIFEPGDVARDTSFDVDRGAGENRFFSSYLDVSAISGVGATLAAKFQEYDEASDTWFDITGGGFVAKTTVTNERIEFNCNSDRIRAALTITGTTPLITFTLAAHSAPN